MCTKKTVHCIPYQGGETLEIVRVEKFSPKTKGPGCTICGSHPSLAYQFKYKSQTGKNLDVRACIIHAENLEAAIASLADELDELDMTSSRAIWDTIEGVLIDHDIDYVTAKIASLDV